MEAQNPNTRAFTNTSYCISSDEFILVNMINDYRRQNNLNTIPLSKSMFFVAHTHVQDLKQNKAGSTKCGLHSWSDAGNWKPCCYKKEAERTFCMNDKPRELTGYKGKGFEMIYWGSDQVVPSDVIDLWKSTGVTNDMLLNQSKWKNKTWKSIGVGLSDGYASVWFGDEFDQQHGIRICRNDTTIDSIYFTKIQPGTVPSIQEQASLRQENRYFLIVGSFKTLSEADQKLISVRNQGYTEATIIEKDNNFRVAIHSFSSGKEAQKMLNKLSMRFKGIWIFCK
jgi:hypothetical protein